MDKTKEIKRFINKIEPISEFELDGKVYQVYNPDDLEERHYISYYEARAMIIDLANQFKNNRAGNEENISNTIRRDIQLQNSLIDPVKQLVESVCQVEEIKVRPKVLMAIYEHIESELNPMEAEGTGGNES